MGNGPTKIVEYSCRGCTHCREEDYCVEDGNDVDSGYEVWCEHPAVVGVGAIGDTTIGDTTWTTPDWCPEWANAREASDG
jgi:hypothetical protein